MEDLPKDQGSPGCQRTGEHRYGAAMVAANKGDKVAQLYLFQTLDALVELIEAVSLDFRRNNPDRYRCLDKDVNAWLKSFDKVGIDVNFPDKRTRARYFEAYLGNQCSANAHPFLEQVKSLQKCAARYVEIKEADPQGAIHCLDCIRMAARGLLQVLIQLSMGTSHQFARAYARTGAIFQMTTSILRDASFAAAFGVNEIGDENWPDTEYNRRGGILVREMMAAGAPTFVEDRRVTDVGKCQLEHFKVFQDCAFYGARTIRLVSAKKWNLGGDRHLVDLGAAAACWHDAMNDLPHKVDRHRFTSDYVAEITGQRKHMHF